MRISFVVTRWLKLAAILALVISWTSGRSWADSGREQWAKIICEELGCTPIMFMKTGVDLQAQGLVTDRKPLKKLGFLFGDEPYKMTAIRIDTGRYLISIQCMARPEDHQEKEIALKTKADGVFPVAIAPAPEGKYTWNSAVQYDMEHQAGLRPYALLEEKPLGFVDVHISDPDKLAALGFSRERVKDANYQLGYTGGNRWEFNSDKEGRIAILIYENSQWRIERSEEAISAPDQPITPVTQSTPGPGARDDVTAVPLSHGRSLSNSTENTADVKYGVQNPVLHDSHGKAAAGLSPSELLFPNSDFENGNLDNWTASGAAFRFQPAKGDNPTARKRRQPSNHQGDFWIGTFEKYQGISGQKPGETQGDKPTGALTSIPFRITGDAISFLIGGGRRLDSVYVALLVDGAEVLKATGGNHESMRRHTWDVSPYKGKEARIVISDQFSGGWGHINADDFRYDITY